MRIIISPAKKMNTDLDSMPWQDLPRFLPRTEVLLDRLHQMTPKELQTLWKCNDQIAQLNVQRLHEMDLRRGLTPAILSYEGIQYQYMAPNVFTDRELAYIQERLRILSGFYGILRPFDGVRPYRLEMQARLKTDQGKDLYSFWGSSLAEELFTETDTVINLASKEYSLCVSRYLRPGSRMITCVFAEQKGEKLIEKGTMCKMARGEMVRYMAEHQIVSPEELKAFDRLDYRFSPADSDGTTYVFIKERSGKEP